MEDQEIREMVLEIIKEVDYDIWKSYLLEFSEDPEMSEEEIESLIEIAKKYIKNENA